MPKFQIEKLCTHCGTVKPRSEFHPRTNPRFVLSRCKVCIRAIAKEKAAHRRATNPVAVLESDLRMLLKKQFRLSIEQFDAMHAEQHGRCAVCEAPVPKRGSQRRTHRRAAVDHDHRTDQIRGLLCSACNMGLGHFRDDPRLLEKAARYLVVKPFALFALEAA